MEHLPDEVIKGLSRRDLLRYSLAGAATIGGMSMLAACGVSTSAASGTNPSAASGPPKKGGTLTVGMISEGSSESVDPWVFLATTGYLRVVQLYDTLTTYADDLTVQPALAQSYEASSDFKTWTFHLRHGVTFHDGSPLTADDIVFNAQAWTNNSSWPYSTGGSQIDPKRVKKIDDNTVSIGLVTPNARFDRILSFMAFSIKSKNMKKGGAPIGTGPFKYASFTPGSRSEFIRFENHWRPEPVYLERLVVNSSFTDENARTNALASGSVDLLPLASFGLVKTLPQSSTWVLRAKSGSFDNFYMAVDSKPFNDVNVRQALRLIVDRQALVNVTYAGYGAVSNDVPGRYTPWYDESLTRSQDLEQAKFLLKKSGHENLAVTLQTSAVGDPVTQAATLLKQQASGAGVTVNFQQIDPSAYWANYGSWTFAQTLYYPVTSMELLWSDSIVSTGTVNETHWYKSPMYGRTKTLLDESFKTPTENNSKLIEIWAELQRQQFDDGGYINYGTYDFVDGVANKVQGLTPSSYLFASGCNLRKAWLSS